ncbi:AAA family ATPase [Nonomuraea sp. LPB2021202275-12-8]|uniref:AAA family ATPase n=1 Tax=Nonomuraea sp. LPB2021202275-12-8 TaxID=3120159 RepID=UPI00300C3363
MTTTSGRLRSGELRSQVARVLADKEPTDLTPSAIAKELGRSSGAVANALQVLAGRGEAEKSSTSPIRYRATATTTAAASSAPPPPVAAPPRPPRPRPTPSPDPSPAAPPVGAVSGPVLRPNGQEYHPRSLSGMSDVTALRKLREAGVAALFHGPPGTGKTSLGEAAFGSDLITVQGDGDTTVADLVGEYTLSADGNPVFIHGPLPIAMREGKVLFLDDATLIPPTVLAAVYPAMDGRRQITIKANAGEIVHAAPGFYVLAGHNPGVHGAVLSDALASRFSIQIKVTSDYDLAVQLKVDGRAVRVAKNLATRVEKGEVGWAPQLRELLAFQKIADVLGLDAAAANLVGTAPEDERATVETAVRNVFGKPVTPLALGSRVSPSRRAT